MNLAEFTDLPHDEQLIIIMEEGVPVAEAEDSHSEIVLYQLYNFYASVYISKSDETIWKFGGFDHPILLQPFLDKIDISDLIKA